jgi:hypothetical protein
MIPSAVGELMIIYAPGSTHRTEILPSLMSSEFGKDDYENSNSNWHKIQKDSHDVKRHEGDIMFKGS